MNASTMTIEFDESTANTLRDLTSFWGVPPQEAVVRAVQLAAQAVGSHVRGNDLVAVFRRLQNAAEMTPEKAAQWKDTACAGRR
jgi:hypothetical protein